MPVSNFLERMVSSLNRGVFRVTLKTENNLRQVVTKPEFIQIFALEN